MIAGAGLLALAAAVIPTEALDRLRVSPPPAPEAVVLPPDRFGSPDEAPGTTDEAEAPAPEERPTRIDTPTLPLECRVDDCARWRLPPNPRGSGPPAVDPDGVVIALSGDGVAAFELATGQVRWTTPLDHTGPETVTLAAVEGAATVLVAGPGEWLRALATADGSVRWEQRIGGLAQVRAARATDGMWQVALRLRDGPTTSVGVVGLDPDDGAPRWRTEAANAALTTGRPVLQDTNARLRGLDPVDGSTVWEHDSGLPGARLTPLGDLLVLTGRADGLVLDTRDGTLLEDFPQPMTTLFVRDGVMVWGSQQGVEYLDGDGNRWSTPVPERRGCCRGFTVSSEVVTTLSADELLQFDRTTGRALGRIPLGGELSQTRGSAWLYGPLVVVSIPGAPRGLAQVHEVATGRHLADITQDAYGLHEARSGAWVLLAPDLVLVLTPDPVVAAIDE